MSSPLSFLVRVFLNEKISLKISDVCILTFINEDAIIIHFFERRENATISKSFNFLRSCRGNVTPHFSVVSGCDLFNGWFKWL